MKRAILVLGAESSGTRLVTRILLQTAAVGSDGHFQPFDEEIPDDKEIIVWRRSFPHNGEWPDVVLMCYYLREKGYNPEAVVIVRNFMQVEKSQVKRHRPETIVEAHKSMQDAYPRIFSEVYMARIPYLVVTYEELILRKLAAANVLIDRLGLGVMSGHVDIRDMNREYY